MLNQLQRWLDRLEINPEKTSLRSILPAINVLLVLLVVFAGLRTVQQGNVAVTTDISEINDIHPKNKQDVGKRLALWALAKHYGKDGLVHSGPLYDSQAVEGNKIRVKFKHVGGGLTTRDGKAPSHFMIAGADLNFVPATATIEGDAVVVTSDKVAAPTAVRYGWDQLAEPNLGNKEGLPASPFRTDDGKLVSAGAK